MTDVSLFKPSTWFKTKSLPIGPFAQDLVAEAESAGIPIRITETRRSADRQRRLYAQGRTTEGPIVTWTLNSEHVRGRAVDITIIGAPEYEDDPGAWELLGAIGEDLGLVWGGYYGDYGHFELPRDAA